MGAWSGEAAANYVALQARWDASAAGLTEVLARMGAALRTAHANYRSAESTNAAIWS